MKSINLQLIAPILLLSLPLILLASLTNAQNALDFDGNDDKISIPNASSLVVNGDVSMSFRVYARNPNPGYPNFDGMAGFRNENDADFYILHYNATTLEARFRNSSGVKYDLLYNGFSINSWHHIVMTYDGTQLKLYDNGTAVDSIPANGVIQNISESFHMGFLPFNQPDFHLNGILDDVSLWSKSLTASEVASLYSACEMDTTDTDLELCYKFNQGTGGGNNTAITTVIDSKSGFNGVLQNFAMNGPGSNFVEYGKNSSSILIETACNEYISPSGQTWTISGTYSDTIPNAAGCDSIITIQLTLNTVDTSVTQLSATTLEANAIVAVYQWLDCDNGYAIIPGATGQQFTAGTNGNYAVQVFQNNCLDTSACYPITLLGLTDDATYTPVVVYPNPSEGDINFIIPKTEGDIMLMVYDLYGRLIYEQVFSASVMISVNPGLPAGKYMARLRTGSLSYQSMFQVH
jgi:hypothetical protein